MKHGVYVFCFLLLMFSLTACGSELNGSRTGNDSEFMMDFVVLNKSDAQDLKVEAGDSICAKVVVEAGQLSIKIQKDQEEPIYACDDVATDEFQISVEKSGIYTVTVTGEHAKGSVAFAVGTNP